MKEGREQSVYAFLNLDYGGQDSHTVNSRAGALEAELVLHDAHVEAAALEAVDADDQVVPSHLAAQRLGDSVASLAPVLKRFGSMDGFFNGLESMIKFREKQIRQAQSQ